MIKHSKILGYMRLLLPVVIVCIVFVFVVIGTTGPGKAAHVDTDSFETSGSPYTRVGQSLNSTETTTTTLYLPIVMRDYPWISPFGVEVNRVLTEGSLLLGRADDLDINWVRMNGRISWRELQPNEGDPIDWSKLANFENEMKTLKAHGMTPVVIIDDHPHWAVIPFYKNGQWVYSSCAAIKTEKFNTFANFVKQVVTRYSDPVYNVHHWELGNEPDVDPKLLTEIDNIYGCWGDKEDPYYGGRHYGEMLKVITPVIKAADPNAQVWIGGLLLDNPNTTIPALGKPEKFLAGILEAGGGPYFDILPYHAYFGYNGVKIDQDNAVISSPWYPWGGMVVGKAKFLSQVMNQYGVGKPLFVNEFALNCPEYITGCIQVTDEFLQIQADQLVRSISRGLANKIKGFAWYTMDGAGWRNGGLLDSSQTPRPSYFAYQNLTAMLKETRYYAPWNYGNDVEAYRFYRGDVYVDVLWAKENQTHPITFSKLGYIEARDRDGALLTPVDVSGNYQLQVGFSPIYLVFDQ